jgi:hypothetical protein
MTMAQAWTPGEIPEPGSPDRRRALLSLVDEARDLVGGISAKMAEIQELLADDEGSSRDQAEETGQSREAGPGDASPI